MTHLLSRRHALALGGSLALTSLSAVACSGPRRGGPGGGSGGALRVAWWGGQARTDRTTKAIDLFEAKHPDVQITPDSTAAYDAYWQKINTQVTGGNAPDLYQHNYRYLAQFAAAESLFDLNTLPSGTIDLTDADPSMVDQAVVGGKRLALPLGANTEAIYATSGLVAEGDLPPATWTWDDCATFVADRAGKLPKGSYVIDDPTGSDIVLAPWLLAKGKQFYTDEGKLGFTADDLLGYFDFWAQVRKSGGLTPAEVQAGDAAEQRMAQKKVAMVWSYSNLMTAFQSLTKDKLAIHAYPGGPAGSPPGHTIIATGLLMAISANSANAETAGQLLNFFINDPDAIAALGTERGMPLSLKAREQLKPDLPETERTAMDYFAEQAKDPTKKSVYYTTPPAGSSEITGLLSRLGQDITFGKTPVDKAVTDFMQQAAGILT